MRNDAVTISLISPRQSKLPCVDTKLTRISSHAGMPVDAGSWLLACLLCRTSAVRPPVRQYDRISWYVVAVVGPRHERASERAVGRLLDGGRPSVVLGRGFPEASVL